jgi:ABC-2 type transport system permease protein
MRFGSVQPAFFFKELTTVELPLILRPLSYILPLTYGVDILRGAVSGTNMMYIGLDFTIIIFFCAILFYVSIKNINRKWIT